MLPYRNQSIDSRNICVWHAPKYTNEMLRKKTLLAALEYINSAPGSYFVKIIIFISVDRKILTRNLFIMTGIISQ